MMGKSHLVISTGLTLSVLGMIDQSITIPVVIVSVISALLPDIDEPNSLIVSKSIPTGFIRFLKFLLFAFAIVSFFVYPIAAPWNIISSVTAGVVLFLPMRKFRNLIMILAGISLIAIGHPFSPWNIIVGCLLIICVFAPHRGLTHTLYGLTTWTVLLFFSSHELDSGLWVAGGLSYLLHLLADALTDRGIRPLPPFKFSLRFGLMRTGRTSGTIIETVCIGLTLAIVWFVFGFELSNIKIG